MPNVLLSVPHFEQSCDGACLPACVQMLLSYLGDTRTEAEISKLLGTKEYGTPIRHAERLREDGYDVAVSQLSRADVEAHLEAGLPISVFLNDPAFSKAPQQVVWDAFLAAWAEYDETAVIISNP